MMNRGLFGMEDFQRKKQRNRFPRKGFSQVMFGTKKSAYLSKGKANLASQNTGKKGIQGNLTKKKKSADVVSSSSLELCFLGTGDIPIFPAIQTPPKFLLMCLNPVVFYFLFYSIHSFFYFFVLHSCVPNRSRKMRLFVTICHKNFST